MKKLFLFAATAIAGFSATAQYAESNIMGGLKQTVLPKAADADTYQPSAKSTIAGSRWYNHGFVVNNDILPGQMDLSFFPIWFDASVKQRFNTGLDTINFSSAGQVVDPIHFTLYNDITVPSNLPNDIAITMDQSYKVDSVSFNAFYVEVLNRPLTIVDTIIFSVSSSGNGTTTPYQARHSASPAPWVNNGYTNPSDTVKGFRISPADDVNRASGVNNVVIWKMLIDSSMRRPDSAGFIFRREFTSPVMVGGVPGSVTIPAGSTAAVTVTFKSGDVINPGDSFNHYNHMYITSGEGAGPGLAMPYFHYIHRDQNMSNLMFAVDPTFYSASVIVEGGNTIAFGMEFHDISAHLVCDDCPTVTEFSSVNNVNSTVGTDVVAYPNPANDEIAVSFIMNQNTNATVSITNAVGQVIATQEVSNVIAKENNIVRFSTANLATGVYFYTVEAQGQRTTNRFVVSH